MADRVRRCAVLFKTSEVIEKGKIRSDEYLANNKLRKTNVSAEVRVRFSRFPLTKGE